MQRQDKRTNFVVQNFSNSWRLCTYRHSDSPPLRNPVKLNQVPRCLAPSSFPTINLFAFCNCCVPKFTELGLLSLLCNLPSVNHTGKRAMMNFPSLELIQFLRLKLIWVRAGNAVSWCRCEHFVLSTVMRVCLRPAMFWSPLI